MYIKNDFLYGIENQTKVEKRMPARISGYEGASYRGQCDKKTIVPVITMVLYYGTDRKWTAPKNLKSLIKVPDNLDKYVNDTKANVFEIAWLTDEQISSDKEGVSNKCDVAQRLEDRGIEKGLQKGREEGNQMIYSLVEDESISMERDAQKLGVSVEKLRANMINAGYKCPDME